MDILRKISIQGYKSIKKLELDLDQINIFIGANGSGKSNFLSFFTFLQKIYQQSLQKYVAMKGIETFLHKGSDVTQEISAKLTFPNTNAYSFTIEKGDYDFIFTEEGLWYDNPYMSNPEDIASLNTESKLKNNSLPRSKYIQKYLSQIRKYHFHDTGVNSPFNKESNIHNDIYFLYEEGSNLAAFLYHIKNTQLVTYNIIIKTIQSIAPYFRDFYLLPEESGLIRLKWQSNYGETIYGVNDLSDGTIRFIALSILFLQPIPPQVIIIDEPELGLHPTAIAKLAGLIKSVSRRGTQVILATQSTDLISHFDAENIITVDQINGESVFERLNTENISLWLEEYTIDDLWKRNIIKTGQPNF
jgi:conserved domain protein